MCVRELHSLQFLWPGGGGGAANEDCWCRKRGAFSLCAKQIAPQICVLDSVFRPTQDHISTLLSLRRSKCLISSQEKRLKFYIDTTEYCVI